MLYDRLIEALFPGAHDVGVPSEWSQFREQARIRERMGWDRFKLAFFDRDNPLEALEEATDLANYAAFDHLAYTRDGRDDEDIDAVLMAMQHAYKAYLSMLHLRRRRSGAP